jgi:hypothetical protein
VTYGDVAWLTVYLVIMVWGGVHVARGEEVTGWGLVILAAQPPSRGSPSSTR